MTSICLRTHKGQRPISYILTVNESLFYMNFGLNFHWNGSYFLSWKINNCVLRSKAPRGLSINSIWDRNLHTVTPKDWVRYDFKWRIFAIILNCLTNGSTTSCIIHYWGSISLTELYLFINCLFFEFPAKHQNVRNNYIALVSLARWSQIKCCLLFHCLHHCLVRA